MAGSPDAASARATRAPQRLAVLPMAFALRENRKTIIMKFQMKDSHNV
jgi:hypothetical protein